jgi:hypothetical protein
MTMAWAEVRSILEAIKDKGQILITNDKLRMTNYECFVS